MHWNRPTAYLGLAAALWIGCSAPDPGGTPATNHADRIQLQLPAVADQAARAITQELLESTITKLADDALQGRGPASQGDGAARAFIAQQLESYGFEPGNGAGGWEQPVELVGLTSEMPGTWTIRGTDRQLDLKFWDDYIGATGVVEEAVSIESTEIVFVGYGITAPEEDWDDFKGADLRGKILLMLNNDPDWDPELFEGTKRLYYGRWTYKYESAARAGAVGAIVIHTTPSAGYGFNVVQSSWTGEQFVLPGFSRLPLEAWVTEDAATRMVALGGYDLAQLTQSARSRDFEPVSLHLTTSIDFTNKINPGSTTANVLGLLPGSDPELADELVVYTAHHDHLGVGQADDEGDTIYNGARDNASGVATVLAIAKAFSQLEQRPRRSILILLVGAEEQGLLGSRYYAANPTARPGKIMANINFDSASIFGRAADVAVIGRGKSGLELLLEQAAKKQDRIVVNEPFPDKGYYYRSDQFNFAKIGVPALYFKSGNALRGKPQGRGKQLEDAWRAERYHQPGDEIYDEWDFSGMIEDAQLGFWVGLAVAQMDDPPGWMPGDEFEEIREASH